MPTLQFRPGLDESRLSSYSRDVLEHLLDASSNRSCTVTCLGRTPREQAEVMHANCLRDLGAQRRLYMAPGQAVIEVFVAAKHLDAPTTIALMEAEIVRQGPSFVSRHCADQSVIQVLDLAQSSLTNREAFAAIAQSHGSLVSRCLEENGCEHLEIPQLG